MRLGITINLGNYESLRIETGEHETHQEAIFELKRILEDWNNIVDRTEFWIFKLNKLLKSMEVLKNE